MSRSARLVAVAGLAVAGTIQGACSTCRGGSPVVVQPRVGGSIGSSGASTWGASGVGLDLSSLFCRPPDPSTQPQPGPGSPPIPDTRPDAGPDAPKTRELPPGAAPI